VALDGDRENFLPNIDIRSAPDTHTWGCQYVAVRNDGATKSEDTWVLAGDLVYSYQNMTSQTPDDPYYVPVGLAMVSHTNLLFATDAMIKEAGGDYKRVVPIHDEEVKNLFPSRIIKETGLRISEIALADGAVSLVS